MRVLRFSGVFWASVMLAACSGGTATTERPRVPTAADLVGSEPAVSPGTNEPGELAGTARDAPEPAMPTPAPLPFAALTTVPYPVFVEEVRRVADGFATAPEVERSYRALLDEHDLTPDDVSLESYSRVRLVFEATRDGGLWGIRWKVTDRMPWSDAIWQQWRALDLYQKDPEVTAVAECDELSALFALLARDVGVEGFVGLHWPTWNHTVAVWEVRRGMSATNPGVGVRLMVPTSQIWLSRQATLGNREFKTDRVVFPYARKDVKPGSHLDVVLARFLIGRLERYGALSTEELLARRARLGSS